MSNFEEVHEECLRDLESVDDSFSLPPEVTNQIQYIINQAETSSKDETADRIKELIQYQYCFIEDDEKADRVQRHLNDIVSKLYGNHYTQR